MTLQGPGPTGQLSFQLGVNEIASAITVGKFVGSLFTRPKDADVFPPLEQGYGIYIRRIPKWLQPVSFKRSGTVLGSGQRKIALKDTLPGLTLDSVVGIATFLILILRYVETSEDIVDYLQNLLKGEYGIVCGGELEPVGSEPPIASLPFSIREPLRSYVRGVLDADADSPQHHLCLSWLSTLSLLVGNTKDLSSTSKYSHTDHRRFIKFLLRQSSGEGTAQEHEFHTLSMGTAMIALTALANGSSISLTCITSNGERVHLPDHRSRSTREKPLSVFLWLVEPPQDVASTIRVARTFQSPSKGGKTHRIIPIHGGSAEISQTVARYLSCDIPAEDCLLIWQGGIESGSKASWIVKHGIKHEALKLCLSEKFIHSVESSPLLDTLASKWYAGPRSDQRHFLARTAATIVHGVYQYSNYASLDDTRAKRSMNLALTAFAIGCLKTLVSNETAKLSLYAMVLDNSHDPLGLLDFCEHAVTFGRTMEEILFCAGRVWGGLIPHLGFPDGRLIGIVCPEMTILLNVLCDPKSLAQHGLAKGIMSIFKGSVPTLPQDPFHGAILAGDPNPERTYTSVEKNKLHSTQEQRAHDLETNIVFTVEPFVQSNSGLSAILCGWQAGDVAFQLDPHTVFHNLLFKRRLDHVDVEPRQSELSSLSLGLRVQETRTIAYMTRANLIDAQYLHPDDGVTIIATGPRNDWQVVAAGCVHIGRAVMVADETDCRLFKNNEFDLGRADAGTGLIFCGKEDN